MKTIIMSAPLVTAFIWFLYSCMDLATNSIILSPLNFWNIIRYFI